MVIEWKWLFRTLMKGWAGITLWPFIFVKDKTNGRLINHEKVHLRQQIQYLIIGFYVRYVFEYLRSRSKGHSKSTAYRMISFEQEAYEKEGQ